ncbi:MAG: aminoglycoside 3'-phosphotransferase [Micrococcaceae bacterium]
MTKNISLSRPFPTAAIPEQLSRIAKDHMKLVWINELGGTTAYFNGIKGLAEGNYYAKWNPKSSGLSLETEVEKSYWLASTGHPTSHIVDFQKYHDGELLITQDEGATSAVFPQWVQQPQKALTAIAQGLRLLHSLPAENCPYTWSLEERLKEVKDDSKRTQLKNTAPEIDKMVVCHGDACAPNTLLNKDGKFAATIDVEQLGVADRWADLAVATMSLTWNYSEYDETIFWESYGLEPDNDRIEYYRALWNASD